jgi:hypothetical protein
MVVELTVPSTRTVSPFLTALAEDEVVPFRYFVEDASSTVTFWPADVVNVKLELDTLSTVPDDPPAAGPDRALDPPPPDPKCPAGAEEDAADAGGAAARPTDSPVTENITAAAMIRPLLRFHNSRRILGRRTSLAMGADWSGEDAGGGGAGAVPPELPATDGGAVALDTGPSGGVSSGMVGSYSFMMALSYLSR